MCKVIKAHPKRKQSEYNEKSKTKKHIGTHAKVLRSALVCICGTVVEKSFLGSDPPSPFHQKERKERERGIEPLACIHHCVCDSSKENFNVLDQVYGIKVRVVHKEKSETWIFASKQQKKSSKNENQKIKSKQTGAPSGCETRSPAMVATGGGSFFDPLFPRGVSRSRTLS